jgi:N-acyl-L-homoserine lactone synthetase
MEVFGPDDRRISQRNILDFQKLRKLEFVDRQQWNIPVWGEFEFDQYDIMAARYVVVYEEGECVGGARLLPCDFSYQCLDGKQYSYMLNDFCFGPFEGIFPASRLYESLPRSDKAWEMTRFVSQSTRVTIALLERVNSYLSSAQAEEVITISPKLMPVVLKRLGYHCRAISDTVEYNDRSYVALATKVVKSSAAPRTQEQLDVQPVAV